MTRGIITQDQDPGRPISLLGIRERSAELVQTRVGGGLSPVRRRAAADSRLVFIEQKRMAGRLDGHWKARKHRINKRPSAAGSTGRINTNRSVEEDVELPMSSCLGVCCSNCRILEKCGHFSEFVQIILERETREIFECNVENQIIHG